jgi:serine/threonine-protein kinase
MGTPYYMSPEQAEGTKAVDHRTDLWAMGVIAYQCLLGVVPFQGSALGELVLTICTKPLPTPSLAGQVPPGFDDWFARACARHPEDRFQSARELTEAFRLLITTVDSGFIDSHDVTARSAEPRIGTTAPVTESTITAKKSSNPVAAIIGVGAAVAVLAAGGALAFYYTSGDQLSPAPSAGLAAGSLPETSAPPPSAATGAAQKNAPAEQATEASAEPAVSVVASATPAPPEVSKPPARPRQQAPVRSGSKPKPKPNPRATPKGEEDPTDFGF